MNSERLLPSEYAFRVYAALSDLLRYENRGVLTAEIAHKAKITYGASYYWIKQFRNFGFVEKPCREVRSTSDAKKRTQIVIYATKKPLDDLAKLVDCDRWLESYCTCCNPPLPSDWPIPKE